MINPFILSTTLTSFTWVRTNFWMDEFFYLCNPFTRSHANSVTDCSTVCRLKTCTVPRVPSKRKADLCKLLSAQKKFLRTRVNGVSGYMYSHAQWMNFQPAEKFDWPPCSHGTVRYIFFTITKRILARWLVDTYGLWGKWRNMSRVIFRETSQDRNKCYCKKQIDHNFLWSTLL